MIQFHQSISVTAVKTMSILSTIAVFKYVNVRVVEIGCLFNHSIEIETSLVFRIRLFKIIISYMQLKSLTREPT